MNLNLSIRSLRFIHWLTIAGICLVLPLLYVKSHGVDTREHVQLLSSLNDLEELNAQVSERILETSFGMLSSYDELEAKMQLLGPAVANLEQSIPEELDDGLKEPLQEMKNLLLERRMLTDQIKNRRTTLKQALAYLPVAVANFEYSVDGDIDSRALHQELDSLSHSILQFNVSGDLDHRLAAISSLAQIANNPLALPPEQRNALDDIRAYARIAVDYRLDLNRLIREAYGIPLASVIHGIYSAYLGEYHRLAEQAGNYRAGLFVLSSLVGIWALVTLLRLSRLSQELNTTVSELNAQKLALDEHAIVSITDTEGRILYANKKFCDITQYSLDELVGRNHRITKSDEHSESFFEDMWKTISSGRVWHGELKNRAKDGSEYWAYSTIVPLMNDDGTPYQYIAIRTDITERKQMEEEVAQTNRFLQRVTNSMGQGLYVLDARGRCTFVNPAAENLLGWSREEMLGRRLHDIIHYQDAEGRFVPAEQCPIHMHTRDGRTFSSEQEVFTHKDGHIFPVAVVAERLDDNERYAGSVGVFSDITERLETEQQLREATRQAEAANLAKSAFLANMSHEIRTPLNAILGMAHLAMQTELTSKQRNYIDKAHRSAETLLTLINDILDFSKIEAGRLELDSVSFWLHELFDDIASLLGFRAEEKGIELLFDIDPDVPRALQGDPMRLKQVLINLCGNAIKFTETGSVVVAVNGDRHADGRVRLNFEVRDTGIGIAPEQLENLFHSFRQADASTTRKYGGTGLGLAISRRLVEMMNGRIWVESQPGQGSDFHFSVELSARSEEQLWTHYLPRQGELKGVRALIVDDSSSARAIFSAMLTSQGVEVEAVDNAIDAGRLMEESFDRGRPYDVLMQDWKMPNKDGVEFCREQFARWGREAMPVVIMMTAHGREPLEDTLQYESFTPATILIKPVTPSALLDAVAGALGRGLTHARDGDHRQHEYLEAVHQLRGIHVLLVEDNEFNREVALEILDRAGVQVSVAGNGEEALQKLGEGKYAGVLMDCQMPVMDGYAATRCIRETAGIKDVPVIAMTANVMKSDVEAALESGMNDHVGKPIDIRELFTKMARWFLPEGVAIKAPPAPIPSGAPKVKQPPDPELQHIDFRRGLSLFDGNRELYVRLLGKFAENQGEAVSEAQRMLDAGDKDAALRVLHTLKGTAGSVGAHRLHELAGQSEHALLHDPEAREISGRDVLADELKAVRAEISGLSALGESGPAGPLSEVSRQELYERLHAQLLDYDAEAEETAEALMLAAASDDVAQSFKAVLDAIARYDFETALELLDRDMPATSLKSAFR